MVHCKFIAYLNIPRVRAELAGNNVKLWEVLLKLKMQECIQLLQLGVEATNTITAAWSIAVEQINTWLDLLGRIKSHQLQSCHLRFAPHNHMLVFT